MVFGDETDGWEGQFIELWIVDTEYNGSPGKGVRIGPVTTPTAAQPELPALPPRRDELDDEIPF